MEDAAVNSKPAGPRILIGHLTSNGDILYSSAIARQIKEVDYPSCHLTWAVSSGCAKTLQLNPYIDEIWEIPIKSPEEVTVVWNKFCKEAAELKSSGRFDHIFLIQLIEDNLLQFNKTIRLSLLQLYPRPITVGKDPVLRLSEDEIRRVRSFYEDHQLSRFKKVILFECAPLSGQSSVSPQFALDVALAVAKKVPDVCFILSSNKTIGNDTGNIISASTLSFRENAELSRYCDLFVGCSSGITWLLTSDRAKKLPSIQLLNKNAVWFNSVVKDHELLNKDTSHVLELYNFNEGTAAACISEALTADFAKVRSKYHQQYSPYWCNTEAVILFNLLKKGKLSEFLRFVSATFKRNNYSLVFIIAVLGRLTGKCITSIFK